MAHRLTQGCSVRCETPHGHNELVRVSLRAAQPAPLDGAANMVVEFAKAKARWHGFVDEALDHGFQLSAADPLVAIAAETFPSWRLVITPGDPTTELMALLLSAKCQALLAAEGVPLRVDSLTLEETPTNAVRFAGSPEEATRTFGEGWWSRADLSTR